MKAIAILALLAASAFGQAKPPKSATKPNPSDYFTWDETASTVTLSSEPCAGSFGYDSKTNTCTLSITFTVSGPITCTPLAGHPPTMVCSYKPKKEPK